MMNQGLGPFGVFCYYQYSDYAVGDGGTGEGTDAEATMSTSVRWLVDQEPLRNLLCNMK